MTGKQFHHFIAFVHGTLYFEIVMTEIFDIERCPRLKIHNILEAGFAFIYKWNWERGERILLGLLEEPRLNP